MDAGQAFQRAVALHKQGRFAEAEPLYRAALAAHPGHFESLHYLGVLKLQQGRCGEALALIGGALLSRPDSAEALSNRASALQALGRHAEAIADYDRATAIEPDFVGAHFNRGNALRELGRFDEAVECYDRALALKPDFAAALVNRGNALQSLNRCDAALASFDHALALSPDSTSALVNRGIVLHSLKRYEAALASYDRALRLNPRSAEALSNRGAALSELGRAEEALATYERALAADGGYKYGLGEVAHARAQLCDWRDHDVIAQRLLDGVRSGALVSAPFALLIQSDDPSAQLACAKGYVRDKCPAATHPVWKAERYRHDRIRVAYVSADLQDHAVARLLAGVFERHDRARFEIVAASFGPDSRSPMRSRLVAAFDRFVDVRDRADLDVANLLREMEIDIAVDLMGHTRNSRPGIFAHRPAPIQVNYTGFTGTTGAAYLDYLVADRFVIPPEDHAYYSEKVVYLPDTFQPNDSLPEDATPTPTRAEVGLPANGFVFCCFNGNQKITPRVFDVWMRLLLRCEGSVLWLLCADGTAQRNLRREAQVRGVGPERLVFAPRARLDQHLARHRLADLFLDTLPYNAATTASDALRAGLPIVTCAGRTFAGRVAGSLLRAMGVGELVTTSLEAYEGLAHRLATDPLPLRDIRERLARNLSTTALFDTDRYRRHLEAAYTTMWEVHQRGGKPKSFAVQ